MHMKEQNNKQGIHLHLAYIVICDDKIDTLIVQILEGSKNPHIFYTAAG